ncbi:MAG: hypothetical protein KKD01_20255 [Proteobacteria bacterium]|nr:hypothetical protein [Pseudomonadota bacterium]
MNRMAVAILLGLLVGLSVAYAQAVQYKAASGYLPDVVTISKHVPDAGRICVEPTDGAIMNCRTIGELRKWARERAK